MYAQECVHLKRKFEQPWALECLSAGTNKCVTDKAIDISGGSDTFCVLLQSGRVRCWGATGAKLGVGTNAGSNVAAPPVAGLSDAVNVSVGLGGVCAVRATGAVVCWGDPLSSGTSTTSAVAVAGITNAKQISVGYQHVCVRTADSKVLCWGQNSYGQLGNGTTNPSSTPIEMPNAADTQTVAASIFATCIRRTSGQVSCVGRALDNGQTTDVSTVSDLSGVSAATSLTSHGMLYYGALYGWFCAAAGNGALTCWGNGAGGNFQARPVSGVGQVLAAVSDGMSYWAIQQDHSLWALGANSKGQLGDGTFSEATLHTTPQLVHVATTLGGVVAVAVASNYTLSASCLLRENGSVSCAGSTEVGSILGDGQFTPPANRTPYVPVVGILPAASEDGQCFDGVDNDGNGLTDLDDPACAQDLGSATGTGVATVPFAGIFGNYLSESCNTGTGNFGGPDAMLTWTAPSGGTYQFDTSGSSFDTVLAAYKGNPQTAAELACNDNDATMLNGASSIQVKVITGDKLTIVVDSKTNPAATDSFNLNITKQ